MFPSIVFDYDYIEVSQERFLKLSSRSFVSSPFALDEFGVISPRAFKPFIVGTPCDGGYFSHAVNNSFDMIDEKVEFLNKFYQCFLCKQLPHKVRKLVVVGAKDSGKSSLANLFFGIMPRGRIATLTKEANFGCSMINEDTELLYVDEWTEKMLTCDEAKCIFQGGIFPQSIKHQSPRIGEMHSGVFITCNQLPDFGSEQENVFRRLAVFQMKTLFEMSMDAPEWIKNNSMQCLVWIVNVLNSNKHRISKEERFYELPITTSANARSRKRINGETLEEIKSFKASRPVIAPVPSSDNTMDKEFEIIKQETKSHANNKIGTCFSNL